MKSGGNRPAAVAGRFYPGEPDALAGLVDALLEKAPPPGRCPRPVAVVAPHAGFGFSGSVAATAYVHLSRWRGHVERVVVLGPSHFTPLRGMAVPSVATFATPLGPVAVDDEARAAAAALPATVVDDEPHAREHAIETQLPFLIRTLGSAVSVLPVVVGTTPPVAVAALLSRLLDPPRTIAVVSTDLSHYLDRAQAQQRDTATAAAVVGRRGDALRPTDACGFHPLRGLLEHAVDRELVVDLLHLATSAETGGNPRRVVGYGAFVVREDAGSRL
jgi:MEMO1 family protein